MEETNQQLNNNNEQFTKKERKEMKRQEKYSQEEKFRRKRKIKKITGWTMILLALGLGVYGFGILNKKGSGLKPGEFYQAQGRNHIANNASHPAYNSDPPTGGWHYNAPAQTGIYEKELPDERIIHNLEHQHVWISYHPEKVDGETVEKLADIAKDFGSKIVMTPRQKNDSSIALAAWEYLLKLDSFDEVKIREFIKAHRGKTGPENIPDFGFEDFRL